MPGIDNQNIICVIIIMDLKYEKNIFQNMKCSQFTRCTRSGNKLNANSTRSSGANRRQRSAPMHQVSQEVMIIETSEEISHQMSQEVMIIVASDSATNILSSGLPLGPNMERATPKAVAKDTRPMMFMPLR